MVTTMGTINAFKLAAIFLFQFLLTYKMAYAESCDLKINDASWEMVKISLKGNSPPIYIDKLKEEKGVKISFYEKKCEFVVKIQYPNQLGYLRVALDRNGEILNVILPH